MMPLCPQGAHVLVGGKKPSGYSITASATTGEKTGPAERAWKGFEGEEAVAREGRLAKPFSGRWCPKQRKKPLALPKPKPGQML